MPLSFNLWHFQNLLIKRIPLFYTFALSCNNIGFFFSYYQAYTALNYRGEKEEEQQVTPQMDMGQMSRWLGLKCDDSLCKLKRCCNFNQLWRETAASRQKLYGRRMDWAFVCVCVWVFVHMCVWQKDGNWKGCRGCGGIASALRPNQ